MILSSEDSKFGIEKQIKMKRKIEDFLRELQPEHAEAALAEFNKPESKEWRERQKNSTEVSNLADAIYNAFRWMQSDKGLHYWNSIVESILHNSYIFPPPQESQDEIWEDVRNVLDGGGKIVDDEWVRPYEYLKSKYKITKL